MQDAKPEEGNSRCQSQYLSEYKATQPPGERTGRTRRKSPHHTETDPRGESLDCKLQARTQEITKQIWAEFAEINTLSQQIVTGDDKDDEAVIAGADAIRAEAIHAIEGFLN